MFDLKVVQTKLFAKVTNVSRMNKEAVDTMYFNASDLYGENIDNSWFRRRAPDSKIGPFAPPGVLVIDGENFLKTTEVLIQGKSVNFEVVTKSRLFAMIPPELEKGQEGEEYFSQSIFVVTDSHNFANSSIMTFGFGDKIKKITGAGKVASQIVKLLMTTPGTDDFEPNTGAGLRAIPGTKIKNGADLTVPVVMAIKRVESHIKASQSRQSKLTPAEKLRAIELININYDPARPGNLSLTLKVATLSQESVAVQMMTNAEKLLEDVIHGNISVKNNVLGNPPG